MVVVTEIHQLNSLQGMLVYDTYHRGFHLSEQKKVERKVQGLESAS